jgi:hypothetical protein
VKDSKFEMFTIGGFCEECGKPYHVAVYWYGVTPPPPLYTCNCPHYNVVAVDYTNHEELPITYVY